jgi:ureidoacrylate peracid hydrolase
MQHFFVETAPEGHEVMKRINRLTAVCRKAGILVIHTTHVFRPNVPNVEEALALHKELHVNPTDIVLEKSHFGAFHENHLEEMMRSRGIDTLMTCGLRTNVCCSATTWEAISRGFRVFFLRDGTATKEMDGVSHYLLQAAVCATFNHLFGNVVTVQEMITRIEEAAIVADAEK